MKLDLGDTYHGDYVPLMPGWVAIELRPCKEPGKVQGDYRYLPFASESITYAYGACFLEQRMEDMVLSLGELYRVLKPNSSADLSCCEEFDGSIHLAAFIHAIRPAVEAAGFVIDDWTYDGGPEYAVLDKLTIYKGETDG